MVIINQKKDELVNFDKVQNIWVEADLDKVKNIFEIYADGEVLGIYKTEERAKEVLEEIMIAYQLFETYKNTNSLEAQSIAIIEIKKTEQKPFAYIMPKE